ncbi:hypothetical protein [Nocardioides insulae]|uniref:hypothetical protein n=1 Tax=Nocardioides insulae TaxID=394734 RepID=UPI0012FB0EA8|nr:hypothetical protein [Nocardioides insulae]
MTTDCLTMTVQRRHEALAERLEVARAMHPDSAEPREGRARIDPFLASASQHLHAVDEVMIPAARRRVSGGKELVHDYLGSARDLEVVLAHLKAHEYGSVYERRFEWEQVWDDVDTALVDQREHELAVAAEIARVVEELELTELADRLERRESAAPTRPHPYTPHTGILGMMGRRVMATADAFWDVAENRMVPEPERPPRPKPGLISQYFLADPRFEPGPDPAAAAEPEPEPEEGAGR